MKKIFVVSCQALEGEPLYGDGIMNKMAYAALEGGANWIRTSQLHNIISMVKDPKINVPIMGIIKKNYPNSTVRITPSLVEMKALIKTGVDIIAIDATSYKRPSESLEELVDFFKKNKKKKQKLMADCSTIEDIQKANELGFDYIGTTLKGHTAATSGYFTPENDFEIIKEAKKVTNIPIVAEGGVDTPELAARAFNSGADIVVVGSQITRPQLITKRFVEKINEK